MASNHSPPPPAEYEEEPDRDEAREQMIREVEDIPKIMLYRTFPEPGYTIVRKDEKEAVMEFGWKLADDFSPSELRACSAGGEKKFDTGAPVEVE